MSDRQLSMKVHLLKTASVEFQEICHGLRAAILRLDDQGFREGDVLELWEMQLMSQRDAPVGMQSTFKPEPTGEVLRIPIKHVAKCPFGLKEEWVMLSLGEMFYRAKSPYSRYDEHLNRRVYQLPVCEVVLVK